MNYEYLQASSAQKDSIKLFCTLTNKAPLFHHENSSRHCSTHQLQSQTGAWLLSAVIFKGLYFVIMDNKCVFYHGVPEALAGHYTTLHIDFSLFPHAVQDKLARSDHILSGGPPAARKQRKGPRRKGQEADYISFLNFKWKELLLSIRDVEKETCELLGVAATCMHSTRPGFQVSGNIKNAKEGRMYKNGIIYSDDIDTNDIRKMSD